MVTDELRNFVDELFKIYTNSWNVNTEKEKKNMYFRSLSSQNIDFDKLMDYIANNWHDKFIPTPADVKDMAMLCLIKQENIQASKYTDFIIYDPFRKCQNSIVAPSGTSEERVLKYLQRYGKSKDWKIINKIPIKN